MEVEAKTGILKKFIKTWTETIWRNGTLTIDSSRIVERDNYNKEKISRKLSIACCSVY
jgi:hypothetical protein